ncbi:MAG: type II toxin-antitoxin system RelE/ParE family toxin [Abitibacteriaceae bacterium]|nr:type II toxin-antitoxin system RelE/ParE family toxin [Abditibacteriaceae bacterium]
MSESGLKPVYWVASARKDLKAFPAPVRRNIGLALDAAHRGGKSLAAKPLRGKSFPGASVLEVVEDFHSDTYRAVYTVRFAEAIYVLHCFQKKSKRDIATPQQEIEVIRHRLRDAEDDYQERIAQSSQQRKRGHYET